MKLFLMITGYLLILTNISIGASVTSETLYLPAKAVPKSLPIDRIVQVDDTYVADLIAEGLFDIGEGFQLIPVLAESMSWNQQGTALKFRLKNATFSDGSNVTPESVISSLERCIKSAESALSVALQDIVGYQDFISEKSKTLSGIVKTGASEIEIRTSKQAPLLTDNLAFSNCFIVKPAADGSIDLFKGAVATGAYVLDQIGPNEISLKRRIDYHRNIISPEHVIFRATDAYGDFKKLKSWASIITAEGDEGIDPDFNRTEHSELGTYQLVLNHSRAPFDRLSVRKAVEEAIDFELLAREMGWKKERLQKGLFPFGIRGFKIRPATRDLKNAIADLKKAGFTPQKPLHLTISISRSKVSEREIGIWPKVFSGTPIDVRVELLSQAELIEKRNAGTFDALRVIKTPGSVDPHRLLSSYLSSSNFNTPRIKNAKCDALTHEALSISDREKRTAVYAQADDCLISNVAVIPLSSLQAGYAYVRKPWQIRRKNRYFLTPYDVTDWIRNDTVSKN